MLSSHLAWPRVGHYDAALHVFSYLKKYPKRSIAFNPRHPKIDQNRFMSHDWYDFYRGAKEPIPGDLPSPLGKPVTTHCYVDASHADNWLNRQSQTGILIFVNSAPTIGFSKHQNTFKMSTFGSKMVALQIAVEQIQSLQFKPPIFWCSNWWTGRCILWQQSSNKGSKEPRINLDQETQCSILSSC